jgi:hypothetical protein
MDQQDLSDIQDYKAQWVVLDHRECEVLQVTPDLMVLKDLLDHKD